MMVALYLNDKIINFKLPYMISGSFSFGIEDTLSNLINIEAQGEQWVLYHTSDVKVIVNNQIVDKAVLTSNCFYQLLKDGKQYLIYTYQATLSNLLVYSYDQKINLQIGNTEKNNIQYACPYLTNTSLSITWGGGYCLYKKQVPKLFM